MVSIVITIEHTFIVIVIIITSMFTTVIVIVTAGGFRPSLGVFGPIDFVSDVFGLGVLGFGV